MTDAADTDRDYVILGRLAGPFGVRGWIRLQSDTEPREGILGYSPWYLEQNGRWEPCEVETGRRHGSDVVVKLAGVDDRDQAAALRDRRIAVRRAQLGSQLAPGEYYWIDLEGLTVFNRDGVELGVVERLFDTGANDVLVVRGERERLVPYISGQVVLEVDLTAGRMLVDWDPEF